MKMILRNLFLIAFLITGSLVKGVESPQNLLLPPASETATTITLHWDKPNEYKNIVGYEIYRDNKFIAYSEKTNYTVKGLLPNNTYSFAIKSKDENGNTSKPIIVNGAKTQIAGQILNIEDYGAIGNGKTLNTEKIQKAIDDCPQGGTVYIPEGEFLSGALFLKSDMTLYIEQGGVLKGSMFAKQYKPMVFNRFEGWEVETYASLINAGKTDKNGDYYAQNISIRGEGTISGGGMSLGGDMIASRGMRGRGRLICLMNCRNVCIQGLTIEESPCWTIHYIYSKDITLHDLKIKSLARNGDGIDPDSSENSYIFNCTFDTNDDCIAIKSGKNPEGFFINKPTKDVFVSYCNFINGHGISIGSEMSGGVQNVIIRDCIAGKLMHGLQIKTTKDRGGYVENIKVRDCNLYSIRIFTSVSYNNDGEAAPVLPYIRNLSFTNIDMSHSPEKNVITVEGFSDKDHYSSDILFKDVLLPDGARIKLSNGNNITLDNIKTIQNHKPEYVITESVNVRKF